jgi:hypothetical protein
MRESIYESTGKPDELGDYTLYFSACERISIAINKDAQGTQ